MKSFLTMEILISWIFLFVFHPLSFSATVNYPPVSEGAYTLPTTAGCGKFNETTKRQEALQSYALYRDQIKLENYEAAFPYWKKVYQLAPAADGKRNTIFMDGIDIYTHFFKNTKDETKRKEYFDTIMRLYDEVIDCYGREGYISGLKAYDLYYQFEKYSTEEQIYNLLKKAIEEEGNETPAYMINPFSAVLINLFAKEKITKEETQKYVNKISEILEYNKKNKSRGEWESDGWPAVKENVAQRFESLEGIKGFFPCEYFRKKYMALYKENPDDCETLKSAYGKMRWGGCDPQGDLLTRLKQELLNTGCIEKPVAKPSCSRIAYDALEEGSYEEAVNQFEQCIGESDDNEKKALYHMLIAKIYYAHLKNFPKSRSYALKSAKLNPNSGEPYLLIGKLYASSGPLCGPGRGWNSQIVTWPAIDKWQYAKKIDPSVAAEANKLIRRYSQFMPSREDIFQRTLKIGDTFKVPCWIQETTKIRPAR